MNKIPEGNPIDDPVDAAYRKGYNDAVEWVEAELAQLRGRLSQAEGKLLSTQKKLIDANIGYTDACDQRDKAESERDKLSGCLNEIRELRRKILFETCPDCEPNCTHGEKYDKIIGIINAALATSALEAKGEHAN